MLDRSYVEQRAMRPTKAEGSAERQSTLERNPHNANESDDVRCWEATCIEVILLERSPAKARWSNLESGMLRGGKAVRTT